MVNLKHVPAFVALFEQTCRQGMSVSVTQDLDNRELPIVIMDRQGRCVARGSSPVRSPDGFPLTLVSVAGCERLEDVGSVLEFVFGLKGAVPLPIECPKCQRAHPWDTVGVCVCGHFIGQNGPGADAEMLGKTVGEYFGKGLVAAADKSPDLVRGDGQEWLVAGAPALWDAQTDQPVKVTLVEAPDASGNVRVRVDAGMYGPGCVYRCNTRVLRPREMLSREDAEKAAISHSESALPGDPAALFYYPLAFRYMGETDPKARELIRESVRKLKDGDWSQPMPRPAPPELTVCGMSINLIPSGSVVVVQNTTNDPVLSAKVASVAVDLMKERPDLRFVVIPADTRLEGIGLEHARLLRDRLNEIVYDLEKKA